MRRFTKILIFVLCLFILAVPAVYSMDAVLGEIVSVDAENHKMIVSVDEAGKAPGTRQIVVFYDRQQLPGFAEPGAVVRLWGEYVSENQNEFKVHSLRHGEGYNGNDPTGVRSRLKQGHGGHGMGMGKNRGGMRP